MPGGTDIIIDMERTLRDKEVQVAHLMACVYDEQNRTQDKQAQVLRLDAERLEMGRKLADMEGIKRLHVGELEARNRAMISHRGGVNRRSACQERAAAVRVRDHLG